MLLSKINLTFLKCKAIKSHPEERVDAQIAVLVLIAAHYRTTRPINRPPALIFLKRNRKMTRELKPMSFPAPLRDELARKSPSTVQMKLRMASPYQIFSGCRDSFSSIRITFITCWNTRKTARPVPLKSYCRDRSRMSAVPNRLYGSFCWNLAVNPTKSGSLINKINLSKTC